MLSSILSAFNGGALSLNLEYWSEIVTCSLTSKSRAKNLSIKFDIANGYYLYKDKIKISVDNEEITKIFFPKSKIKEDEFFGKSEIYDKNIYVIVEKNNKRGTLLEVL